jgi:hypothetical protein
MEPGARPTGGSPFQHVAGRGVGPDHLQLQSAMWSLETSLRFSKSALPGGE